MSPLAVTGPPLALHAFVVGYEPISEALSLAGGDPARFLLEPVTAAAVTYRDGWVLVDGGFNLEVVRDQGLRARHLNYEGYTPVVPPGDPLADALARAGLAWDDLAGCVISHAHLDHTGAVPRLPRRVPVVVQRREWDWVVAGAARADVVLPGDLLGARDRVVLVDGDADLAPGLGVLDTAGHTPGHQSVVVDLGPRRVVLACDAADLDANLVARRPCGWAVGERGPQLAQRAVDRLADLRAAGADVWPGHDPSWGPWAAAMRGEQVTVTAG